MNIAPNSVMLIDTLIIEENWREITIPRDEMASSIARTLAAPRHHHHDVIIMLLMQT